MPLRRLLTSALAAVTALAATLLGASTATAATGTATRYVFTAFTNSSQSNMFVYTSSDATTFSTLKATAYTPPSGLVRDPSVLRAANGYYYVAYTNNWTGTSFGIARSKDLLNWSFVTTVEVGVAGTQETWAPEWFVDPADGSISIIVSLSSQPLSADTGFAPYRLRATDATLTSFGTATPLTGIGPNYIDTFVVRDGSTYYAFTKNETTKYIEVWTASSLGGRWTLTRSGNWAGWGTTLEGPTLTRLPSGAWRIFMDNYSSPGRYYTSDSTDLVSWTAKAELSGLSGVVRHGTVLRESVTTTTSQVLVGSQSGRCLTAPTAAGGQVTIEACTSSTRQLLSYSADGRLTVGGVCLDAKGQGTANGTVVTTWACNGGSNQAWTRNADGSYTGVQSGRCLDVTNQATAAGSPVTLFTCNGGSNQAWSFA